jgi:hypothetical protein
VAKVSNSEFTFIDGIAIFRPIGRRTLQQGVQLLREAIARANAQRIAKLMLVITEVTGYEVPSLAMRSWMVPEWADAAGGSVSVAVVCRPEYIDPQKFGIRVATSLGMVADVFESEDEAIGWLRDQH